VAAKRKVVTSSSDDDVIMQPTNKKSKPSVPQLKITNEDTRNKEVNIQKPPLVLFEKQNVDERNTQITEEEICQASKTIVIEADLIVKPKYKPRVVYDDDGVVKKTVDFKRFKKHQPIPDMIEIIGGSDFLTSSTSAAGYKKSASSVESTYKTSKTAMSDDDDESCSLNFNPFKRTKLR